MENEPFSLERLMAGGRRAQAHRTEATGAGGGGGFGIAVEINRDNNNNNNNNNARRGTRRRQRPEPSLDDILNRAVEAEEAGSSLAKKSTFTLKGLPEFAAFHETYGRPRPQEECLLCRYTSHTAKDQQSIGVEQKDMISIVKIIREGAANCNWLNVAIQITKKWREMADRINKRIIINNTGEPTLEYLDPATANEHLNSHVLAPELITNSMLGKLKFGWDKLWSECVIEKDKESGVESFSEPQMRNAQRMCTMIQSLMKNRPSDLINYQKDVHSESSRAGRYIQTDTFRFVNLVKKRKRM